MVWCGRNPAVVGEETPNKNTISFQIVISNIWHIKKNPFVPNATKLTPHLTLYKPESHMLLLHETISLKSFNKINKTANILHKSMHKNLTRLPVPNLFKYQIFIYIVL